LNYIGELAGLATSLFWSITVFIFKAAGRMVGSQVTNRIRLVFALIYLMILNAFLYGEPLPVSAEPSRWWWLGVSGLIGLTIGDAFLFQAFVAAGARLGSLLLSLAPIFGAFIAWVFFGETLTFLQVVGIAFALAGISWVVASNEEESNPVHGDLKRGILFGVLGALCQAVGLVLSKQGMLDGFSPFKAGLMRMSVATFAMWSWTGLAGKTRATFAALREKPRVMGLLSLGALMGPVLGVSMSLVAVQNAEVGVASTLMALPPVIVLPISYFVFREKVGWQAVAGTLLAIAGVAVLFLA
jgi:drug/metabolite transporter (DMT)-like permease